MTEGAPRPVRSGSARRWVAAVLVVITSLLVVVSAIAGWAHRTVLDSDRFMAAVGPALEDPALYDRLADEISVQTLEVLDLDTRLTEGLDQLDGQAVALLMERFDIDLGLLSDDGLASSLLDRFDVDRPTLGALGPLLADRLEGRIEQVVERVVTADRVRALVPHAVRGTHHLVVEAARADLDEYPNVYVTEDAVVLDTLPLVVEAVQGVLADVGDALPDVRLPGAATERADDARAALQEAMGERLPDGLGQIELIDRATFDGLQTTVTMIDRLAVVGPVLAVLALVVTLVVAPDRRRAVVQLTLGILTATVLAAAGVRELRLRAVELTQTPEGANVAATLADDVTQSLRSVLWLLGALAVVAMVVALFAGRPAWLQRAADRWPWVAAATGADGRLPRWVREHVDSLRVGVLVVGVLVVVVARFHWVALVLVGTVAALAIWGIELARRSSGVPGRRAAAEQPSDQR